MADSWLAHSENALGRLHPLREHLYGVCELGNLFAASCMPAEVFKLAALLHDMGKYLPSFQPYLRQGGKRGSVPHARWGALLARTLQGEEVSFAIDGHHAGLPDYSVWANEHTFADNEAKKTLVSLYTEFKADTGLQDSDILALCKIETIPPRIKDIRTRLIFSCLTDAGWLDTEAHFSPDITAQREHACLNIPDAIARVDASLKTLGARASPMIGLRTRTRLQALRKACLPVGFFALNLPTGLGKTLTSFRWALEHAQNNDFERIIIVLPYTSIIDQTAVTLAAILGQDPVLEHHSSLVPAMSAEDDTAELNTRKKLACENWDYPVIITTTVHCFETLFSNTPGKCRKLHHIACL